METRDRELLEAFNAEVVQHLLELAKQRGARQRLVHARVTSETVCLAVLEQPKSDGRLTLKALAQKVREGHPERDEVARDLELVARLTNTAAHSSGLREGSFEDRWREVIPAFRRIVEWYFHELQRAEMPAELRNLRELLEVERGSPRWMMWGTLAVLAISVGVGLVIVLTGALTTTRVEDEARTLPRTVEAPSSAQVQPSVPPMPNARTQPRASAAPPCPEETRIAGPVEAAGRRFCIDRTEVSVSAYLRCPEDRCPRPERPLWSTAGRANLALQGGLCNVVRSRAEEEFLEHPMNCVDADAAAAFCDWRGGRLPSESEWQWVAYGSNLERAYPWGADPPSDARVNLCGLGCERFARQRGLKSTLWTGIPEWDDGHSTTAPVDSMADSATPSTRILHLAGNVAEWLAFELHSEEASVRGGGFLPIAQRDADPRKQLRREWQTSLPRNRRYLQLGFRCVTDATDGT